MTDWTFRDMTHEQRRRQLMTEQQQQPTATGAVTDPPPGNRFALTFTASGVVTEQPEQPEHPSTTTESEHQQ